MNAKHAKLLRKFCKLHKRPYKLFKKRFNKLDGPTKLTMLYHMEEAIKELTPKAR